MNNGLKNEFKIFDVDLLTEPKKSKTNLPELAAGLEKMN